MKSSKVIGSLLAFALIGLGWFLISKGNATIPMDHQSALSKKDYANGSLREKDVVQRMTPRLTRELAQQGLKLGDPVFIRIFKESRELELWVLHKPSQKFRHFKTWPIAAMSGKLGPKLAEGDRQAPEGFYHVGRSRMKPDSRFHLAFNVGYPNAFDLAHQRSGSFIMVHGNRVSIGCFAMTDPSIEEIYTISHMALKNAQHFFRVHIFPFRLTADRLAKEQNNPNHTFWANLKQGYDHFNQTHIPPNVTVKNKTYLFKNVE
jgi:murein L,D-transpeptidase YafK